MDIANWNKKNCISISAEDLRQGKENILSYIQANPRKIYLFPAEENILENCPRFATEIELPCALKLIGVAGEVEVNFLSEILENALQNSGKNFLIVPENFSDIQNKILRQCAILKVPLEFYTDEEFKIVNEKNLLAAKAEMLLAEIDAAKNFSDCKLKFGENILLLDKFFDALNKLQKILTVPETDLKIAVIGENLTAILKRVNIDAVNLPPENLDAAKNFDAVIFEIDAANNFTLPKFDNEKIIFVLNIPASIDGENTKTFAQIFREINSNESLVFAIEAANIFYDERILNFDDLSNIERIIDEFKLTPRESYFLQNSLEKFLENVPPVNEKILQKTGVPYLKDFLMTLNRKNLAATADLFSQIDAAFAFLENGAWQKIYSSQIQNLKISALQTKILYEKILAENERGKNLFGEIAMKAALYDAETAIKNFSLALEETAENFIARIVQAEEFSEDNLSGGDISEEFFEMAAENVKNFCIDAENLFAKLHAEINFSHQINFAEMFSENLSAENLKRLAMQNTKFICLEKVEPGANWKNAEVKQFYLLGNFRRALSQNLTATANKKIAAIADDLRQKISATLIENFKQKSKNFSAHYEKICNDFKTAIQKIGDDKNNLTNDAAIIEKILPNLKNLMALWREIFPAVKSENILIAANEILTSENIPVAEKFTAPEIPCRKNKKPPENITKKINTAITELQNRNSERAFELFAELATRGDSKALGYFAYMHQKGCGTEINLERAINLYLDAFYLGNTEAAGNLGYLFKANENLLHALEWYKIGAANGDNDCKKIFK